MQLHSSSLLPSSTVSPASQLVALTKERTTNPYRNRFSPIQGLTAECSARNLILETSSSSLFSELDATHRKCIASSAKRATSCTLSDYAVVPFTLAAGRFFGDIFASELTCATMVPCRTLVVRGSAPRVIQAYADAPYGFLVLYRDVPQALVSYVVAEGPSLFIVQSQGLSHSGLSCREKGTARLHLRDLLLDISVSVAKSLKCSSISYQGAKNNRWVHEMIAVGEDDGFACTYRPRLSLDRTKTVYDDFCLSRGFCLDEKSGNYTKAVY